MWKSCIKKSTFDLNRTRSLLERSLKLQVEYDIFPDIPIVYINGRRLFGTVTKRVISKAICAALEGKGRLFCDPLEREDRQISPPSRFHDDFYPTLTEPYIQSHSTRTFLTIDLWAKLWNPSILMIHEVFLCRMVSFRPSWIK